MRVVLMRARRAGFTRYMGKLMEALSRRREIPDWPPVCLFKIPFNENFVPKPKAPVAPFSKRVAYVVSTGNWVTLTFRVRLKDEIKYALDPGAFPERMVSEIAASFRKEAEAMLCGASK